MAGFRCTVAAVVAAWITFLPVLAGAVSPPQQADFAGQVVSSDAQYVAQWALDSADNRQRAFAVVDKRHARIFVFDAHGRLLAQAPVLLGLAPGDHAVPGTTLRQPSELRPFERTTPAGRFVSEPGHNLSGEDIVWLDYAAKLAIHRVRADGSAAQRLQRLASATPDDNRVSLGCVVVPVAFYETVVRPLLGQSPGVVYVLPESRPVREVFYSTPATQPLSYAQR